MSDNQPAALLDLAIPRKLQLVDRGRTFVLTCRRVEPADWLKTFAGIVVTSEQRGAERVNTSDAVTPGVQLAEHVITGAEGYKVEGGVDLASLPDWQKRLPLAHRQAVGRTLADVRVSSALDEYIIRAEGEEVALDCTWTLDEATGKMSGYTGLKHILKSPTAAQQKRYNQANSRSVVVGGSRSGKTIYAGAQDTLCELYDELVLSVEGYAWNGATIIGAQEARECMDLMHKFVAAQELFNPAAVAAGQTAEEAGE